MPERDERAERKRVFVTTPYVDGPRRWLIEHTDYSTNVFSPRDQPSGRGEVVEVVEAAALVESEARERELREGFDQAVTAAADAVDEIVGLRTRGQELREAIASAMTSLATGPAKDGYAYSALAGVVEAEPDGSEAGEKKRNTTTSGEAATGGRTDG